MIRNLSRPLARQICAKSARNNAPLSSSARRMSSSSLHWSDYPMAPKDPILGLTEAYNEDEFEHKVNIGVGAYRDDNGKPYVLKCVLDAEAILMGKALDHEYSGIAGDPEFVKASLKFAYGDDSVPLLEGRVGAVQTLSGTGGLRVFGEMLRKFGHKQIYLPNPSWGNHTPIFKNADLEVNTYRYYDKQNSDLDFDGMVKDIKDMPEGTCLLLHACAHNPTGMDPTIEQWKQLSEIIKKKKLLPFFDCAYQGFASGNAPEDAAAIRMFVEDGHHLALVQSFSKNFGLYGQRVGALSIVGANEEEARNVESQLKVCIRPMYSNPPRHGARIVSTILSDPKLTNDFIGECKGMADRIHTMRGRLVSELEGLGSVQPWGHITKQIGMFAYSGLSKDQVVELRENHHIYCTLDGRISMAGVTSGNVDYIAGAIHEVSK